MTRAIWVMEQRIGSKWEPQISYCGAGARGHLLSLLTAMPRPVQKIRRVVAYWPKEKKK